MFTAAQETDRDPDILLVILQRVRLAHPALTDLQLREIELQLRAEYGGVRFRVAKRKKHPTPEERRAIVQEALGDATNEEITGRRGIHRATLFRYFKRPDG